MSPMALFLFHSVVVIGLPYALWRWSAVRRWLPLVVVQIAIGVALGPTILGRAAPEAWAMLFPPASVAALDGLVWLAVTFFAFATGLHFDLTEFRGRGRAFAVTSVSTIAAPTLAGIAAGLALAQLVPGAMGEGTPPWLFAAGIGIAIGVTALPVLAAILREMGAMSTPLGADALGCAAVNDAALWVLMAALLAIAGGGPAWGAPLILGGGALYALVLWFAVRPLLARLLAQAGEQGRVGERDMVVLAVGLSASALASEMIGLHAVVGGFAFGALVPKEVARAVLARFEAFLMVILLPFFFIVTGLKTDFALEGGAGWVFALTFAVSVVAKLASAALPARAFGRPWNESLALGALVGCKGLMELVVLTMLLEAGILSPSGFAGMVLMALATTALARPLAEAFLRKGR